MRKIKRMFKRIKFWFMLIELKLYTHLLTKQFPIMM